MWRATIQTRTSPRLTSQNARRAWLLHAAVAIVLCVLSAAATAPAAAEPLTHQLAAGAEVVIGPNGVAQLRWDGRIVLGIEGYTAEPSGRGRVSLSELAEREGGALIIQQRRWPYFHLDGIVFWELRLPDHGKWSAPGGVALRSEIPSETIYRRLRVHRSVGVAREYELELPLFRLKREGDHPLFVTVLRSDGRPWRPLGDGIRWALGESETYRISLALVIAESEDILWHDAGQALFTGELGVGHPLTEWVAPPLCARCAHPVLDAASIVLRLMGSGQELELGYGPTNEHGMPSHRTLHVGGLPLADRLIDGRVGAAFYLLEQDDERSARILAELQKSSPQISLLSSSGQPLTVDRWTVSWPEVQPANRERPHSSDLPNQLSPELLQAWPNPFAASEGTTIHYVLPTTLGQAFELDDDQRRRLEMSDPPPFGLNPGVGIRVYNVQGQLVRDLLDGAGSAGEYEIYWDGRDAAQRSVAAGAYFLRMELGDYSVTRRAILLKQ